jgi:thymidylate synthase
MTKKVFPSIDEQYKILVQQILDEGRRKGDPQGVGNITVHGFTFRFDMSDGSFPLLGLRDLSGSRKAMMEELFWIMSGSTNVKDLHKQNVHFWDQWADATKKDFPDYPEGELGPVYGRLWRTFDGGGDQPVDQLKEALRLLKENPNSRRIVISVWNPAALDKVFISPCIRYLQFHYADGHLGLSVVQGSADVPVGIPFDIAEYATFLRMVAHVMKMTPAILDYHLVDAHIYLDQIDSMKELIKRDPTTQPTLTITSDPDTIFDFKREDFVLEGYQPHPKMNEIPVAL